MSTIIPYASIVVKVRILVHTLGYAGWDKSRNHWSIFLILEDEISSVRFNMHLQSGSDELGTFSAILHPYVVSASYLTYFDYPVHSGLQVGFCLNLITSRGRRNYRMTGSGNGCRYWVWTVFSDFVDAGYIPISPSEKQAFVAKIQMRYHRSAQTNQIVALSDAMEQGEFVA